MTTFDTGTRIEDQVRGALRSLRPVDGASARLSDRIASIPDAVRSRSWLDSLLDSRGGALLATGLIAGFGYLLIANGVNPAWLLPGSGGKGPPAAFNPTVEGPGLTYGVIPTLLIVPATVAVLAAGLALRLVIRNRGIGGLRERVLIGVLAVFTVLAVGLMAHPGFVPWNVSYGPFLGYGLSAEPPPGSDGKSIYYATVNPGELSIYGLTLTNPGPLPIRLEGLIEDPARRDVIGPRYTALTATLESFGSLELDKLPTFQPVVVPAGEQLWVVLVSRAGPCAFGPDFTVLADGVSGYIPRPRELLFAYSVLGLSSSAPFDLPVDLVEPQRNGCRN